MIKQFPARTFTQTFHAKSFHKWTRALFATCCVVLVASTTTAAPSTVSIFNSSTVPVTTNETDGAGSAGDYELGMKVKSAVAGQINAIRYYKATSEKGSHIGRIWSSTGQLLASVTFANETTSGWQEQSLATPLNITPNTTYVVSVNANDHYAVTDNGLATTITNGGLSAVADGKNGVYNETPATFPTQSYLNSNYFRDIVFAPSTAAPATSSSGTGNGLKASYRNGTDAANSPIILTRTDAKIDFDWALGSPSPSVPSDRFSIKWEGEIQPRYTGEYTFYGTSDDGNAVIVNGQTVVSDPDPHSARTATGKITLEAGKRYPITVFFYEATGSASMKLEWSSANQSREVVPTSQLYSTAVAQTPTPTPTPAPAPSPTPTPAPTPTPTPAPSPTPAPAPALTSSATAPVFPLEVMGVGPSYGKTITINVPSNLVSQIKGIKLRTNNLASNSQGKVQIGANTSFIDLTNTSVSVLGNAKTYGGIGGAFSTVEMILPLPSGRVVAGDNLLTFQQNQVNNGTVGYRVLNVDFVDANNNKVTIPGYSPQVEDPSKWAAPAGYQDQASIAAGQALYEKRDSLKDPTFSSLAAPRAIKASCVDCHVKYGTDLKYYSFSNLSIIERAKFHGLSDVQGKQIAAYIRNNSSPAPGRPWNPPYQPGPGTDSKPIQEWAAGAGVDWVLPKDSDSLPYLFPNGIGNVADISPDKNRSAREIPVAMQFPDWNHWLPKIHPLDAWGTDFSNSTVGQNYDKLRAGLTGSDSQNFKAGSYRSIIGSWNDQTAVDFRNSHKPSQFTPESSQKVYGTSLWELVKTWELEHEFNLEGYASNWYGNGAESRMWPTRMFFFASPAQSGIPDGDNGLNNGPIGAQYLSNAWYHVQVVINDSNSMHWSDNVPVDPPYWFGFSGDLNRSGGAPDALRLVISLQKFMHGRNNGIGPDNPVVGWNLRQVPIWLMSDDYGASYWGDITQQDRAKIYNAFLRTWLDKTKSFAPSQYYAGASFDPSYPNANYAPVPHPGDTGAGPYPDRIMSMISAFREQGVNGVLLNEICDWGKSVWPRGNWDSLKR